MKYIDLFIIICLLAMVVNYHGATYRVEKKLDGIMAKIEASEKK